MFVYSKKIIQFITEIKFQVKEILTREVGVQVAGDRFYDRKLSSYPIKVVVYNDKSMLGYFDPDFYELGFHEELLYVRHEELKNVIRHELAHYITFINHGGAVQPHGVEFKAFCERMGWDEKISQATLCVNQEQKTADSERSAVFRKVQKLMALAKSSNRHEAEQAMIKSRELLVTHNMESTYSDVEEGRIFLKRIFKQKRRDAKMRSIAWILETFFVSPVYSRAGGFIHLEICGEAVNIEIAEYVASVLQNELDALWEQAKESAHLKGMVAKNSFFLGLARGYCNKIQALKREYSSTTEQAVMVIEKKLTQARAMIYGRLSSSKSSAGYCAKSSLLGEEMGRQLHINPAINRSSNASEALLTYST